MEAQYQLAVFLSNYGCPEPYYISKYQHKTEALLWLTRAAENNHPLAIYALGAQHAEWGNYEQATTWLQKAIDKNLETALENSLSNMGSYNAWQYRHQLAYAYYAVKNYQKGKELYSALAKQESTDILYRGKNKDTQYYLGKCLYQLGEYKDAVNNYKDAVLTGSILAQSELKNCILEEKGITKEEGFHWYRTQNNINVWILGQCGICCLDGIGTEKNVSSAFSILQKAVANNAGLEAATRLGDCYYWGHGVTMNFTKAREQYEKGTHCINGAWQYESQDNSLHRAIQLTWCYCKEGLYEKAFPCLVALLQTNLDNQLWVYDELARCYLNGHGTQKDLSKGAYYAELAASKGNISAQNLLGWCYYNGIGVEKNYVQAVYWFQKAAADKTYNTVQFNLGLCYENGNGVEKNLEIALEWFKKAQKNGYAGIEDRIATIEKTLASEKAKQEEEVLEKPLLQESLQKYIKKTAYSLKDNWLKQTVLDL